MITTCGHRSSRRYVLSACPLSCQLARALPSRSAARRRSSRPACPLDCPDACSLSVTVQHGKVVDDRRLAQAIRSPTASSARRSASSASASTDRTGCSTRPSARAARAKDGSSASPWDEALELIAERMQRGEGGVTAARRSCPYSYGGSNGLLTQDNLDATLWRRLRHVAPGAHALRGADRRRQHGALRQDAVGHLPGLSRGHADRPLGRQSVGVRHSPGAVRPRGAEARRQARRRRPADDAAGAVGRRAPGGPARAPTSPSRWPSTGICSTHGFADDGVPRASTRAAPTGCASAPSRGPSSAAAERRRHRRRRCSSGAAELYADQLARAHPLRLGARAQPQRRQRRDGGARAAGGRRQVRRARRRLLDEQLRRRGTSSGRGSAPPSPTRALVNMNHLGRALTEYRDPPVDVLFVYNCNPAATVPDQHRVLRGLEREDLFTVVFEQVMTDTALYADVVLPATTFLEGYDFAKAYGPISLELATAGRSTRSARRDRTPTCSASCAARLGRRSTRTSRRASSTCWCRCSTTCPARSAPTCARASARCRPSATTPVQFVDVFPNTPDRKVDLFPDALDASAPDGLYRFQPDPATERYPLALISPASDRTISSTLGELPRPDVKLTMHPGRCRGARAGDGDLRAHLQRARRSALPAERARRPCARAR